MADVIAKKFDSYYFQLPADPTAWQTSNLTLLPTAPWNTFQTDDPEVIALTKVIQTGTEAEADAASADLNAYVVDQAWFAPWYTVDIAFASSEQTDVTQQPLTAYPYLYNIKPKQ